MPPTLNLDGKSLTFDDLKAIEAREVKLAIPVSSRTAVERSRDHVSEAVMSRRTIYGVNTGFGRLSDQHIEPDQLDQLQKNLLRSHAVGLGKPFHSPGLFMALRANSLLKGRSGVSIKMIDMLVDMYNAGLDPVIPELGSVGASGDLAPLAELGCVMMGEGQATFGGKTMKAAKALQKAGLRPYRFGPKEALGLINGTQFISATLSVALVKAEAALKMADIAGSMSLEALKGSIKPFDGRVHMARPHPGQGVVAANVRRMLTGSEVLESHRNCTKVQDAYSLRCIPQVHGAVRDAFEFARGVLMVEVNSATDNPLVFDNGDILSAGNFHGQPVAQAADFLAIALATLGNISERRIDRMTNPDLSDLPAFLIKGSGLQSGFMMVQVAAAAMAAEARVKSSPASVHSIPTGASKEDHVSMGPAAARKCVDVAGLVTWILELEMACAAQGLDFLKPLRPGRGVEAAHQAIRKHMPFLTKDTYMRDHLKIAPGEVIRAVETAIKHLL